MAPLRAVTAWVHLGRRAAVIRIVNPSGSMADTVSPIKILDPCPKTSLLPIIQKDISPVLKIRFFHQVIPPLAQDKSAPFRILTRNDLNGKPVKVHEIGDKIREKKDRDPMDIKDRVVNLDFLVGVYVYLMRLYFVKIAVTTAGRDVTVDRAVMIRRNLLYFLRLSKITGLYHRTHLRDVADLGLEIVFEPISRKNAPFLRQRHVAFGDRFFSRHVNRHFVRREFHILIINRDMPRANHFLLFMKIF